MPKSITIEELDETGQTIQKWVVPKETFQDEAQSDPDNLDESLSVGLVEKAPHGLPFIITKSKDRTMAKHNHRITTRLTDEEVDQIEKKREQQKQLAFLQKEYNRFVNRNFRLYRSEPAFGAAVHDIFQDHRDIQKALQVWPGLLASFNELVEKSADGELDEQCLEVIEKYLGSEAMLAAVRVAIRNRDVDLDDPIMKMAIDRDQSYEQVLLSLPASRQWELLGDDRMARLTKELEYTATGTGHEQLESEAHQTFEDRYRQAFKRWYDALAGYPEAERKRLAEANARHEAEIRA